MRKLIILFVLFIISCSSLDKKIEKNKYVFNLSIGSCFKKDKVLIKLNDTILLDNILVTSDEDSGFSNIWMTYYKANKESIMITQLGDKKQMRKTHFDLNTLLLEVYRNNQKNTFYLDLKKGNHIVIDGCDEGYKRKVYINYYNGVITYE
ncbi:hypothetical protein [uncultured Tenacibaculum sp.]|uniref:hypothetical protein n=1 Tax=uncultured Tenacibaculum sp. TaxID=174713 RepID=UPI00260F6A1F|nr:hypothetical protein [uncultured Tenacibaculum sp.]